MESVLLVDATRACHIIGLAAGFGLALCADFVALRSIVKPVTASDVWTLWRLHRIILAGLAVLWGSGLYLVQVRTGWELSAFSPKLLMKLAIVVVLTVNAVFIGSYALPNFAQNEGRRFGEFDARTRLRLSAIAGVSLSCWLSALALGVFSQLRPMSFEGLQAVFAPVFLAVLAGAVLTGVMAVFVARILRLGSRGNLPARDWPGERQFNRRPPTTLLS